MIFSCEEPVKHPFLFECPIDYSLATEGVIMKFANTLILLSAILGSVSSFKAMAACEVEERAFNECRNSTASCEWEVLTRREAYRAEKRYWVECFCNGNENAGALVIMNIQERNTCTNETRSSSYTYTDCDPCP